MLLIKTFNRDSTNTMLPSAFVGQADSLAFFRFVLGLIRSFLWLSIFVSFSLKRSLDAIHLLHRNPFSKKVYFNENE